MVGRRAARRRRSPQALLAGDVGAAYRRATERGREPRPRHPHDAVAGRRPGAAERPVGVPVPSGRGSSPASAARRSCACSRRARWRRRRSSTAPCGSSASSPARATSRRSTSTASAGASSRRSRRWSRPGMVAPRLARAGHRRESLRLALRDGNYHVIHYVGHSDFTAAGDGRASTSRTPTTGSSVEVDETLFANLLSDQNVLRLVVLNSCEGARTTLTDPYAGVATTLVQLGVPAVVAMQFEISDRAAIVFAEELYTNLIGRRDPIDAAGRRGPQGRLQRRRPRRVGDAGAVRPRPGRRSCSASASDADRRRAGRRRRPPTSPTAARSRTAAAGAVVAHAAQAVRRSARRCSCWPSPSRSCCSSAAGGDGDAAPTTTTTTLGGAANATLPFPTTTVGDDGADRARAAAPAQRARPPASR